MGSAEVLARSFGGNGGGGGGSAGVLAGAFGGGGRQMARKSNPTRDLGSGLVRLARTVPDLNSGEQRRAVKKIVEQVEGLPASQRKRVVASLPPSLRGAFSKESRAGALGMSQTTAMGRVTKPGGDVLSKGLDLFGRLGQGTVSGVAEATREGGWQNAELGRVLTAAKEGLQGKRRDTIASIVQESTGYKLKGVGGMAANLGGAIALDPLTYVSFGTSAGAKAGIRASTEVLGAARTAEIVEKGAGVMTAAEKAALAERVTPRVMEAFEKGVRGGLKVQFPKPTLSNIVRRRSLLSEPRTIIAGPFSKVRAARIIEGTGGLTDEAVQAIRAAEQTATAATDEAERLMRSADLADVQGIAGRGDVLRGHAEAFAGQARRAVDEAERLRAAAAMGAKAAGESLINTPIRKFASEFTGLPVIRQFRETFVPREVVRLALGERAAEGIDDLRVLGRGASRTLVEDVFNQLRYAAKKSKVTEQELVDIIGPALDIGGDATRVPDRLRPVYDAIRGALNTITEAQLNAGVLKRGMLNNPDTYLPRVATKEFLESLGKQTGADLLTVPGRATVERPFSGSLRARVANLDLPIQEINARAVAAGGVKNFEDNPLIATMKRTVDAANDIATRQYTEGLLRLTDDAGRRFAFTEEQMVKRLGENFKVPKGYTDLNAPGLGKIYVPDEIAVEARKAAGLFSSDEALNRFMNGLDKWMTLWKGYATVPLPFGLGFHLRNAMGNVGNNWLAGIMPGDPSYFRAARIQSQMARGAREGDVMKFLAPRDRVIVERAREYGAVREGFFGFDLGPTSSEMIRPPFRVAGTKQKAGRVLKAANPLSTDNILISAGRKLGSAIEDNARLAHFIYKMDELGSAAEAARSVRKYLFDYSDLTATERQLFKRVSPFYTFTRKNLPLQIGAMLKTPGKLAHLQEARVAVASQSENPEGLYPGYLPELGGVPLPMSVSRGLSKVPGIRAKPDEQMVLAPDLPTVQAAGVLTPAAQVLAELPGLNRVPGLPRNERGMSGAATDLISSNIGGGAPGAVLAALQAFGAEKEFFSGRPLKGRVAAPLYAKPFADQRVLNGERQPTISAKSQFLAESAVPILPKVSSMFPQGSYEQEKAPRRRISMATGLRLYPLGPGTSRGEALRRLAVLNEYLADLRAQGIVIQSSRTKSQGSLIP